MIKQGGEYISTVGKVKKIDKFAQCKILESGMEILIDDIVEIDSNIFPNEII